MNRILIWKILRDNWLFLFVVALLLFLFEALWARVTYQIHEDFDKAAEIVREEAGTLVADIVRDNPELLEKVSQRQLQLGGEDFQRIVKKFESKFLDEGPGEMVKALIGGDSVNLQRTDHLLSIGYVHPLVQIILCIWAIGRASGAIAGEIDKGTMELLLAQPIARQSILFSHFLVDCMTIPVLCLSMWAGAGLGCWLMSLVPSSEIAQIYFRQMPIYCLHVAGLLYALSGFTMWFSANGRSRNWVMGITVIIVLVQFLLNVIGQIWVLLQPIRPFTIFYYYQPQLVIQDLAWVTQTQYQVLYLGILFGVGTIGYLLALWSSSRRNLPAPL